MRHRIDYTAYGETVGTECVQEGKEREDGGNDRVRKGEGGVWRCVCM